MDLALLFGCPSLVRGGVSSGSQRRPLSCLSKMNMLID
jgi:hypothetical protein